MINTEDFRSFLLIRQGLDESTIESQLSVLKRILAWFSVCKKQLNKQTIEEFLLCEKKRGLSNGTLNNYLICLKLVEAYFRDRGISVSDLTSGYKSFTKQRPHIEVLSVDEIESILKTKLSCQKYGKQSRSLDETYLSLTMLFAYTGCRYSEGSELIVKYVNLGKGTVSFVDTKNGENRNVHIEDPLLSRLADEMKGKSPTDYVFTSLSDKKIIRQNYSAYLKKLCKLAGITKDVHPHLFRHSFITTMLENDVPLSKVKNIVGHKDIKSTDYYTHLADDSLKKAMYHHPLIRKNLDPLELIKQIKENIQGLRLDNDIRLNYEIIENGNSISLKVELKN